MAVIMLAFVLVGIALGNQITLVNNKQEEANLDPSKQESLVFVMDLKDFTIGDTQINYNLIMEENNGTSAVLKVGIDSIPTESEYEGIFDIYPGLENNFEIYFVLIRKSKIYFVLTSEYFCRFQITVKVTEKAVKMIQNRELKVTNDSFHLFSFDVENSNLDFLSICLTTTNNILMYITKDLDEIPDETNTEPVFKTWSGNSEYRTSDVRIGSKFLVYVDYFLDEIFYIMVKTTTGEQKQLVLGKIQKSIITIGQGSELYFVDIETSDEIAKISLETSNGNGYILISHLENISDENFDFASAYQLKIAVIINPEDRVKLGKTTGKYFIRVFGSGIMFYSLFYENSKSKYHKIPINYPESGVTYENQITYFTFEYLEIESKIMIFLDVLTGNSDLYAKVCKTDISNCEFTENEIENPIDIFSSSLNEGNEYIEIPHYPKNCQDPSKCSYIIGILGKTEKSNYQVDITSTKNHFKLSPGKTVNLKTNDIINFSISDFSSSKVIFKVTALGEGVPIYSNSQYSSLGGKYAMVHNSHEFTWTRGLDFSSAKGKYALYTEQDYSASEAQEYWFSVTASIEKITYDKLIEINVNTPIQDLVYNISEQNYQIYFFSISVSQSEIEIKVTPILGKVKFSIAVTSEKLREKINIDDYLWIDQNISFINDSLFFYMKSNNRLNKYENKILVLVEGEEFIFDKSAVYLIQYSQTQKFEEKILLYPNQEMNLTIYNSVYINLTYPISKNYRDILISFSGSTDMYKDYHLLMNNTGVGDIYQKDILFWEDYKDRCLNLNDTEQIVNYTECYLDIVIKVEISSDSILPGYINIMVADSPIDPVQIKLNKIVKRDEGKPGYYYCNISAKRKLIITIIDYQKYSNYMYFWKYRIQDRNKALEIERPQDILYAHESKYEYEPVYYLYSEEIKQYCPSGSCTIEIFIKCTTNIDCSVGFTLSQNRDEKENYIKIVILILASCFFMIITLIIYFCQKKICPKFRKNNLDDKKDVIPASKIEMQRFDLQLEEKKTI